MRLIFNGQEYFGPRGPAGPDGNPIGSIISYLGRTPPRDYLACDGGEYRISDYPELAAFFQQQFGSANHFGGDGEANFAVPDMRNLFLRGYHGEAEETLSGEVGQRQEGTEIPMILNWGNMLGGGSIAVPASGETVLPLHEDRTVGQTTQAAFAASLGTNVTGAAGDLSFLYTARPVNAAVLYCIKAAASEPVLSEYDTADGWHVRKWSDGYVEMQYKNTYSISNWSAANNVSGVYTTVLLPSEFPIELVEIYQEQVSSIKIRGYMAILWQGCYNKSNGSLTICQNGSDTSEWMVYLNVTGRWK